MVEMKGKPASDEKITEDEAALYDRQIRLWGLDAQNRLRNGSVLVVGLSGLGAEIAKNLVLAGLKSLTLMDSKNRAEASLDRCQKLNPMVKVTVETCEVESKSSDYFAEFDLVCVVDQSKGLTTNYVTLLTLLTWRTRFARKSPGGNF